MKLTHFRAPDTSTMLWQQVLQYGVDPFVAKITQFKDCEELRADMCQVNAALEDKRINHDLTGLACCFCADACNQPATPSYHWNHRSKQYVVTAEWKMQADRTKYGKVGIPSRKEIINVLQAKITELEKQKAEGTLDEKWAPFLTSVKGEYLGTRVEEIYRAFRVFGEHIAGLDWVTELGPGFFLMYGQANMNQQLIERFQNPVLAEYTRKMGNVICAPLYSGSWYLVSSTPESYQKSRGWKTFMPKARWHNPMTGQPYNFGTDGTNQLLVVKVGADYFVARWGEAAKEEKWTFKPSNGDHWRPMAISTIVSYLKMHSVLKEIGTINIQEAMEGRMGQETHGVRQDIMLYAIQSIQQRTRKALGTWCHVHWLRRAPFRACVPAGPGAHAHVRVPDLAFKQYSGPLSGHRYGRGDDSRAEH